MASRVSALPKYSLVEVRRMKAGSQLAFVVDRDPKNLVLQVHNSVRRVGGKVSVSIEKQLISCKRNEGLVITKDYLLITCLEEIPPKQAKS